MICDLILVGFFSLQVSMGDHGLWTRGKFSSNGKAGFLNRACNDDSDFCKVASAFYLIKKKIHCEMHHTHGEEVLLLGVQGILSNLWADPSRFPLFRC